MLEGQELRILVFQPKDPETSPSRLVEANTLEVGYIAKFLVLLTLIQQVCMQGEEIDLLHQYHLAHHQCKEATLPEAELSPPSLAGHPVEAPSLSPSSHEVARSGPQTYA